MEINAQNIILFFIGNKNIKNLNFEIKFNK